MKAEENLAKKKENLQNMVASGCPLGHDFINSNCPIRNARKLTEKNMAQYVNSLSEEQIDDIFLYHEDCNNLFS